MKIAIFEFRQETNSFNPALSTIESFKRGGILEGEQINEALKGTRCAVTGILAAIEEAGGTAIPCYSMVSQSGGIVKQSVVNGFLEKAIAMINENEPFDGVFISLHGATQSTKTDDVCGYIISSIRSAIGDNCVISASCDLHANVTPLIIQNTDLICGYHTYPHEDYFETGYRAGKLGLEQIQKKNLHTAYVSIPMIVPANSYSTLSGPFHELMEYGNSLVSQGKLSDFSIFQMQPWLDVSVGGSSVIAIGLNEASAKAAAREIAVLLLNLRHTFKLDLYTIDEVIDLAKKNKKNKPVVLVDSADSTNAGAAGDSVAVVQRILERDVSIKTAFVVDDAPAAAAAHKAGVGNSITVSLGGTKDHVRSKSITVEAYVKSLHDGIFVQEGPSGYGLVNNIGLTAVLRIADIIDIVVCHNMAGNGDLQLYRSFGVEPLFYQLVVVKACTSFRTAYESIAGTICMTDTPGAARSNMFAFKFNKLPQSFYPFSNLDDYSTPEAVCSRQVLN